MGSANYITQIFPRGISEEVYTEQLRVYSKTLIEYGSELQELLPHKYHALIPFAIYLCPLCLKNHFIKTGSGIIGTAQFSLDHLPPQSAGGKYKLITCKKCNNDSGAFEAELEKLLNYGIDKSKPAGNIAFDVQLRDDQTGKVIKGLFQYKDGNGEVVFKDHQKKYNKQYIDFLSRLHSKNAGLLQIQVPLHDQKKVTKALLKSAYLLCFYWWGYEFAFSANGAFIRDVIAGKKDYPCHVPINWRNDVLPTGISLMQDGDQRIGFLVHLPLKGIEVNTTACIVIPSPNNDGLGKLALLSQMSKAFTCITLPRIVDRIGYTISWNLVIPKR